jgi:hypothetical protein
LDSSNRRRSVIFTSEAGAGTHFDGEAAELGGGRGGEGTSECCTREASAVLTEETQHFKSLFLFVMSDVREAALVRDGLEKRVMGWRQRRV